MTYTSQDGKRTATVHVDWHANKGWAVTYKFPSGMQCVKSFGSKRAASDWAKGYVNDQANA